MSLLINTKDATLKAIFWSIFKVCWRTKVTGLENLPGPNVKAVFIANHQSFLDGPMIASMLPGKRAFAVDWHLQEKWWARPFMAMIECIRIDPLNPMGTK